MKIKKNGKIINLTEGDLKRIVKKILNETVVPTIDEERDLVDLKEGYGKIKDILMKIFQLVSDSGQGMGGKLDSQVKSDIESSFSSLSFDKLINLFSELNNEQFLKSFTNEIEFEDEYKAYIVDKLKKFLESLHKGAIAQKEAMNSKGKEESVDEGVDFGPSSDVCDQVQGEKKAKCIMKGMVDNAERFYKWMVKYENMMGKTNRAKL